MPAVTACPSETNTWATFPGIAGSSDATGRQAVHAPRQTTSRSARPGPGRTSSLAVTPPIEQQ